MIKQNNKIIITLMMFLIAFSLSYASSFTVQAIGEPIKMMVGTSYNNDIELYLCPNSWTNYALNISKNGVSCGDAWFLINYAGESCARALISGDRDCGDILPGQTYNIQAKGYDYNTGIYSSVKSTIISTADSSFNCNDNTVTCEGVICTIHKGSGCSTDADSFNVQIYTVDGRQLVNDIGLSEIDHRKYIASDLFPTPGEAFNKPVLFIITSYDAGAFRSNQQVIYSETGGCPSSSFQLTATPQSSTAKVKISGFFSYEYSSFAYDLYRYQNGAYIFSSSGTSTGSTISLIGLNPSTQYKIQVQGYNPCNNGYYTYKTFTTSSVAIVPFTLSYNSTASAVTVKANNTTISGVWNWAIYDYNGDLISESTTTTGVKDYSGLSYLKTYLVTVENVQPSGSVYAQTLINLASKNQFLNVSATNINYFDASFKLTTFLYNGTQGYFPENMITINAIANSSVENLTIPSITHSGESIDFFDVMFNGLSPNTDYTIEVFVTGDNLSMSNKTNFKTLAVNLTDWQMTHDVTQSSMNDFNSGSRSDVDMIFKVFSKNYEADNLTYTLYDNATGTPIRISSPVSTSSPFQINNILPKRNYMVQIIPTFGSTVSEEKNLTFSQSPTNLFRCDEALIDTGFNASFETSGGQLTFYPTVNNQNDLTPLSTTWTVSIWDASLDSFNQSTATTNKQFFKNVFTAFLPVGVYNSESDDLTVSVTRNLKCLSSGATKQTERYFTLSVSSLGTGTYGAFEGVLNFFDGYFPTKEGKFAFIMSISVTIGIIAFVVSLGNGLITWAVALTPIILGLIIALVFGFIPTSIFAFIGLGIVVVVMVYIGSILGK